MKRIITVLLMGLLCFQLCAFAQGAEQGSASHVEPRGVYLWKGSTSITPGSGYVTVSGDTKCFSNCTEVKVEIVVYQETSSNVWQEIWRQSYSAYNTREVYSLSVNVPVGPGRYKVGGDHYAINGGTKYNYSESNPVTVY